MPRTSHRIAVVTPYGLFNYGNRLQNYAVHTKLLGLGYTPETLILRRRYPRQVLRDIILDRLHSLRFLNAASRKYRSFKAFDAVIRKQRIWSKRHLNRISGDYSLYVFGSDQIWNPYHIDFDGAEYGSFLDQNMPRVSLSASFGVEELPSNRLTTAQTELAKFKFISVREFSGSRLVNDLIGVAPDVLIDPTLSVPISTWRAVSDHRLVPSSHFVLVYLLGKHEESVLSEIREYASRKGFVIVILMDERFKKCFHAGPQDFLALIDRASVVITDSFHAATFSLLFDTSLMVVPRKDEFSMNSRFDTLSRLFGLEFETVSDLPSARKVVVHRQDFENELDRLRSNFDRFLSEAVGYIGKEFRADKETDS
ncbi:polysaccharide pyruvyl transferase family protein [Leucobacter sp. Z1108]|uniref:polysaccharide pyruvyl transferase family protein n=1 Tax=Leucobacter sp. Z1108 TaxID=3439066 RepID=UPI003F38E724